MQRGPRRLGLAAAACVLVLGATACAHPDEGRAAGSATARAASSVPPSTAPGSGDHVDADVMFAVMMVPHHLQALEMADLVPSRSTDPEVLALARQVKAAQQPEIEEMTSWLGAWGASPEIGHEEDHDGHEGSDGVMTADQVRELGTLTGPAFDRRWLELMIRHHEGAVDMAEEVVRSGRHAPTRRLATGIIGSQQAEVARMRAMLGG